MGERACLLQRLAQKWELWDHTSWECLSLAPLAFLQKLSSVSKPEFPFLEEAGRESAGQSNNPGGAALAHGNVCSSRKAGVV